MMIKITYNIYFAYYQDNVDKTKPIVTVHGYDKGQGIDQVVNTWDRETYNSFNAWLECMKNMLAAIGNDIVESRYKAVDNLVTINFISHAKLTNVQHSSLKMLLAVFEQYKNMNYHSMTIQTINRVIRGKTGKPTSDPSFVPKCDVIHFLLRLHNRLDLIVQLSTLNTATKNTHSQTFNAFFQMCKTVNECGLDADE